MDFMQIPEPNSPYTSTVVSQEASNQPLNIDDRIHTLRKIRTLDTSGFYSLDTVTKQRKWHARFILHPNHGFLIVWDLIIFSCILYLAISIPVFLCFLIPVEGIWVYLEFAIQILYIFDIIVSLNTGFFNKGGLIMIRSQIARHYVKNWLFADLMSSFPFVWMLTGNVFGAEIIDESLDKKYLLALKLPRMIRLLKLLKIYKMKKIVLDIEDFFRNHLASIWFLFMKLFSRVLIIAHWAACLFYYVAYTNLDRNQVNWLIDFEANEENNISKSEFYVTSMYWAITTMVSVGYGDFHPLSTTERFFGIFSMACLSSMFAFIIGNLSSLISAANSKENNYRDMISSVNKYMKKKKLPRELQYRVRSYIDYMHESDNGVEYDEDNILSLFSSRLKDEIYECLHGHVIKSCVLFSTGYFTKELIIHLPRLLNYQAYAPVDSIFEEGEASRTLYFIVSGEVEVFHPTSRSSYAVLGAEKYFGEIGFFIGSPRCASVKSLKFTEMFLMGYSRFYDILVINPEDEAALNSLASQCKDMDYSSIYIACYLCKKLGHVAARCKSLIFNLDQEHTKNVWLEERRVKGHKIPWPSETETPKRNRKAKHGFYGSFNDKIAAIKRYKRHDTLKRKVDKYYEEEFKGLGIGADIKQKLYQTYRQFSSIYKITESDEEEKEEIRSPIFDISLIGNSFKEDYTRSEPM